MRTLAVLTILLCYWVTQSNAQSWVSEQYGLDQGLPSELVKDIHQDPNGMLWVATDNGVASYDGISFQNYHESVSSLYTKKFCARKNGELLLATDFGIDQIRRGADTVLISPMIKGGVAITDSTVAYPKTIYEGKKGDIWVGEKKAIIHIYNNKTYRYVIPEQDASSSFVHSFLFTEDEQNMVWAFSYPGGLLQFKPARRSFIRIPLNKEIGSVTNCIYRGNRTWLVSSYSGVFHVTVKNGKAYVEKKLPLKWAKRMVFINEHELLIGTRARGVFHVPNTEEPNWTAHQIPITKEWTVNSLTLSTQKRSVWVGTDQGVRLLTAAFINVLPILGKNPTIHQVINGPEKGVIVASGRNTYHIYKDKEEQWLADKLWEFDGAYVMKVVLSQSIMWMGMSSSELYGLDLKDQSVSKYKFGKEDPAFSHIEALWASEDGSEVYLSKTNSKGFYKLNFTDGSHIVDSVEYWGKKKGIEANINIIQREGNWLWMGGEGPSPLIAWNLKDQTLSHFQKSTEIPNMVIEDISPTSKYDQTLKLATNQGIYAWSPHTMQFQPLVNAKTDQKNKIALVRTKDEKIWTADDKGIICWLDSGNVIRLDKASGLPSKTVKKRGLFIDKEERIWVATAKGLAYIEKEDYQEMPKTPAPSIRSLSVNGTQQKIQTQSATHVRYDAYIEVECAPLSYPSNSVLFQTRLIPRDTSWTSPTRSNHIDFSDLSSGEYTLQVRTQHLNGYSWSSPTSLQIIVDKPWFLEWWSLLIGVLFIYTSFLIAVKIYTWRLRKSKAKLARAVKEHMTESVAKNKVLNQQKEALARQKEYIEERNQELEDAQQIIELQNIQLVEANQFLEEKVKDRTKELKLTMQELSKSHADLDYFIYRSAHDLKGPVARISGLAQIIKHISQDKEVLVCADHLEGTVTGMNTLLSRLLETLELKTAEVILQSTNLKQIITEQLHLWHDQGKITPANIKMTEGDWPYVQTDANLLGKIIGNIIQNAISFQDKKVAMQLSFEYIVYEAGVLLRIKDNGQGIIKEAQERIFDLFYIGNVESNGAGLGLYEAKTLIHKINGKIRLLKSRPNETVFELELPLG